MDLFNSLHERSIKKENAKNSEILIKKILMPSFEMLAEDVVYAKTSRVNTLSGEKRDNEEKQKFIVIHNSYEGENTVFEDYKGEGFQKDSVGNFLGITREGKLLSGEYECTIGKDTEPNVVRTIEVPNTLRSETTLLLKEVPLEDAPIGEIQKVINEKLIKIKSEHKEADKSLSTLKATK